MIPIVGVGGKSGSGKTTLVVKLIEELKGRGWKVGTIKHTRHKVDIDHPGKDSRLMFEAGAESVALSSENMVAMYGATDEQWSPDQIVSSLFPRLDLVIVEGFAKSSIPRIAVLDRESPEVPDLKGLIAVVSDKKIETTLPVYTTDQVKEISNLFETYIKRKSDKRDVKIFVNDKRLFIKPFIKDMFLKTVAAMVDSLKGTRGAERISITIDCPRGELDDA